MSLISSLSHIDPSAKIGNHVTIGPWCYIGPHAVIGDHTKLGSHVVIGCNTTIGTYNTIHSFASIGGDPQVSQYVFNDNDRLVIGDRNVFHEYVTINRGWSLKDQGVTTIGSNNLFQVSSHVGHDCEIGNDAIFGNASAVAGHVKIQDGAVIGAWVGVHQFCQIGAHSFLTHSAMVSKDILPYMLVSGNIPRVRGVNNEGLKRKGFRADMLTIIKAIYKEIFIRKKQHDDVCNILKDYIQEGHEVLVPMLHMLESTERGVLR